MLLNEALALIQKVPHVYLWPCNCRAMMQRCKKPGFVCLRFSNNRNLGWEISKERAREIMLEAHKKGLMQSAEVGLAADGSLDGAICNCCSDCCYPVQLADYLNETKLYPLIQYLLIGSTRTFGRGKKFNHPLGSQKEQQIDEEYIGQQDYDGLSGISNSPSNIVAPQGLTHQGGQTDGEPKGRHEGNGLHGKSNVAGCQFHLAQPANHEDEKGKGKHVHGKLQGCRNTGPQDAQGSFRIKGPIG